MEAFIEAAKNAGPAGLFIICMGLSALLVYVNAARLKAEKTIAKMHEEKAAMFREWKDELESINERLLTTVTNNTHAIMAHSQNAESMKSLINIAILGGRLQRSAVLIDQPEDR